MPNGRFRRLPAQRGLIVAVVAISIFAFVPHTRAASKSRVFGSVLFVTGVGLKYAGVVAGSNAQRVYDDYLTTAVQSEIAQRRDDYRAKRRTGTTLSNAGNGLLVAGALLTALSAVRTPKAGAPLTLSTRATTNHVVVALGGRF